MDYTDKQIHFEQIHQLLKNEEGHIFIFSLDKIKKIIQNKNAIIAIDKERVIGFVKFYKKMSDKILFRNIWQCGSLVVHPDYRNRGIGKQLIKKLLDKIALNDLPIAVVRKTNINSENFFRKIGAIEAINAKTSKETFYFFDLTNIRNI
ncbi:GNAT family N-acetyltransferase [Candidatus Beckwithbacteria bacterium]|nr:GNAT family N-acetyltransferase [Candidatus Beckwithbacteria bacterium]